MPGVSDWLKKASNDLKASKKLSDDHETFDCAVFHTHQCAEKAFKAFIVPTKQPIPKTHDLKLLLEYCVKADAEFVLFREDSRSLDAYGHDSRYPNDSFSVDKQDVVKAIVIAEELLVSIKRKLSA